MRGFFAGLLAIGVVLASLGSADAAGKRPSKQKVPKMTAEEVFKKLDANKSGKLTWSEFKGFTGVPDGKKWINKPKDAKDLADIFKKVDTNDDKAISLEEFQVLEKDLNAPPAKEKKKKKAN